MSYKELSQPLYKEVLALGTPNAGRGEPSSSYLDGIQSGHGMVLSEQLSMQMDLEGPSSF